MTMTGLEEWHLKNRCAENGTDTTEIDHDINYRENKAHLQTFDIKTAEQKAKGLDQEAIGALMNKQTNNSEVVKKQIQSCLNDSKCFLILGARKSGKTALGYRVLEWHKETGRECFFFRHPNPNALPAWISNATMINSSLPIGAIVFLDECQFYFNQYANRKKTNQHLVNWLATMRHRDQSLVLSSQNSRFINLNLTELIDILLMKKHGIMEQDEERPTLRRIYNEFDLQSYEVDEYLWKDSDIIQKARFNKPNWFSDELSKAYAAFIPEET